MSDTEQRMSKSIPPDGSIVRARTYPSLEYDREPEEVEGKLKTYPSPFGTPQCWVEGVQVDPETITALDE